MRAWLFRLFAWGFVLAAGFAAGFYVVVSAWRAVISWLYNGGGN